MIVVRHEHQGQDSTYLPACQTQLGMMSFCTTCTEYERNAFSESTDWGALIRRRDSNENILKMDGHKHQFINEQQHLYFSKINITLFLNLFSTYGMFQLR